MPFEFNPATFSYTLSVPYSISSLTANGETSHSSATVTSGTRNRIRYLSATQLNTGENVFGISIFSKNKKYYKVYRVRITREAPPVTTGFDEAGAPAAVHVYTANGRLYVNSPAVLSVFLCQSSLLRLSYCYIRYKVTGLLSVSCLQCTKPYSFETI
ncbi:MAG: cadherin-like beta sandwich domain-containing protein [Dysgonamonadaceae bacterium]|nr:cadherin-like beta sandwich domain-containing protein [Dysgonamonadaceae bacterium]